MATRGPHNSAITWLPYTRVAWGGSLGDQGEIWTNSLKFWALSGAVITPEQATTAAPAVWAALSTWMGSSASKIGTTATLKWLKLNAVGATGLQGAGDTNVYAGTPKDGGTTAAVPMYQTFALTLRTALHRGRAHAGRIFPPVVGPILSGNVNGRAEIIDATGMATAFATCMVAMQTALRTAIGVGSFAVLSPGNSTKGTTPLGSIFTTVECDTVPDVQHRRTDRLVRQIGALAPIAG